MARRPEDTSEGGLYHLYNRVSSGEPFFADPNKAIGFIKQVCELAGFDFNLY